MGCYLLHQPELGARLHALCTEELGRPIFTFAENFLNDLTLFGQNNEVCNPVTLFLTHIQTARQDPNLIEIRICGRSAPLIL